MKKATFKFELFTAAVLFFFLALPQIALADITSGSYSYRTTTDGTAAITKYTGTENNVAIPASLGGYKVTSIGINAFLNCTSVKSVTIPDGVTSIGIRAFFGCVNLSYITMPGSVTVIGDGAFLNCSRLSSFTIPANVTYVGDYVFEGCVSLTKINVGVNNKAYSALNGVLYDKSKTKLLCYPAGKSGSSFTVPEGVTSIWNRAFWGCTELRSVTIPASVTFINRYAFYNCSSLAEAKFKGNAPSMDIDVFHNCASNFKVYYLNGKSGFTNPWYDYPTESIPAVPAGLKAAASGSSRVIITWQAAAGADGYEVFRTTGMGGAVIGSTRSASFTDASGGSTGLISGRTYFYKVRAYILVGTSKVYSDWTTAIVSVKI